MNQDIPHSHICMIAVNNPLISRCLTAEEKLKRVPWN
jgi:hypothetical protein